LSATESNFVCQKSEYASNIDRSGLEKTDKANKRQANKRLKEKLDRIKDAQAIGDYEKKGDEKFIIKKRAKKQPRV